MKTLSANVIFNNWPGFRVALQSLNRGLNLCDKCFGQSLRNPRIVQGCASIVPRCTRMKNYLH